MLDKIQHQRYNENNKRRESKIKAQKKGNTKEDGPMGR